MHYLFFHIIYNITNDITLYMNIDLSVLNTFSYAFQVFNLFNKFFDLCKLKKIKINSEILSSMIYDVKIPAKLFATLRTSIGKPQKMSGQ